METKTIQILNELGETPPDYTPSMSEESIVKAYLAMRKTRLVDEKMIILQRQGLITFALSSLGEECCSVACAAALDAMDWIYPQYREVGVMFWRGFSIVDYVHHMFGDQKDLIYGRQMPNHFGDRKINVVTVSSPIGTNISHAAGAGFAMKLQQEQQIVVTFFGEGATSEGDFHAGLNFAAVLEVPVLFFCRNNAYAISTSEKEQFKSEGVAPKGVGYGIETYRIDGNDLFAVHDTVKKGREKCLQGKGPILIEAMTYRRGAHSTSDDPSLYRSKEEEKKWEEKDPLKRLKRYLIKQKIWDDKKEKAFSKEIDQEIREAIQIAKETPRPFLRSLFEDVYSEMPGELKKQYEEAKTFFPEEN